LAKEKTLIGDDFFFGGKSRQNVKKKRGIFWRTIFFSLKKIAKIRGGVGGGGPRPEESFASLVACLKLTFKIFRQVQKKPVAIIEC
jgi:hypothetical protein